jgi:hypothetical protein
LVTAQAYKTPAQARIPPSPEIDYRYLRNLKPASIFWRAPPGPLSFFKHPLGSQSYAGPLIDGFSVVAKEQ